MSPTNRYSLLIVIAPKKRKLPDFPDYCPTLADLTIHPCWKSLMYSVNTLSYCQITTNMRNKTSFNHRFWERLFLSGCSIDKLSSGAELNESMQCLTCAPHNCHFCCLSFKLYQKTKTKTILKRHSMPNLMKGSPLYFHNSFFLLCFSSFVFTKC